MATPPRAVLFDADGVLQHMSKEWRHELADRLDDHAPDSDLFHDIARAEQPTMTGEDVVQPLTQVLERHEADLKPEEVLDVWQDIEVDEGVLQGVRDLADRGVVRALTTNQNAERGAWMQANLPYAEVFDAQFYSCDVGLAKPDPAYFRHVLEALGVSPEEALFMDDTVENVESARNLGLRAELFAVDGGRAELNRILRAHGLA